VNHQIILIVLYTMMKKLNLFKMSISLETKRNLKEFQKFIHPDLM